MSAVITKDGFEGYLREVDALIASATAHQQLGNIQAATELFAKANRLQRAWSHMLSNHLQSESSSSLSDFVGVTRMTTASKHQRAKKTILRKLKNVTTPPSLGENRPWRSAGKPSGGFDQTRKESWLGPSNLVPSAHRKTRSSEKKKKKTQNKTTSLPPFKTSKQCSSSAPEFVNSSPLSSGLDALDKGVPIIDQAWWHSTRHSGVKNVDLEKYRARCFGVALCYGGRDWSGFFHRLVGGNVSSFRTAVLDPDSFYSMLRRVMRLTHREISDDNIAALFHAVDQKNLGKLMVQDLVEFVHQGDSWKGYRHREAIATKSLSRKLVSRLSSSPQTETRQDMQNTSYHTPTRAQSVEGRRRDSSHQNDFQTMHLSPDTGGSSHDTNLVGVPEWRKPCESGGLVGVAPVASLRTPIQRPRETLASKSRAAFNLGESKPSNLSPPTTVAVAVQNPPKNTSSKKKCTLVRRSRLIGPQSPNLNTVLTSRLREAVAATVIQAAWRRSFVIAALTRSIRSSFDVVSTEEGEEGWCARWQVFFKSIRVKAFELKRLRGAEMRKNEGVCSRLLETLNSPTSYASVISDSVIAEASSDEEGHLQNSDEVEAGGSYFDRTEALVHERKKTSFEWPRRDKGGAFLASLTSPESRVTSLSEVLKDREVHIAMLTRQLNEAGLVPITEVVSLENAEESLKRAYERLMGGESAAAAQAEFDRWDTFIRNHPDHLERQRLSSVRWATDQLNSNMAALKLTRSFVPPDIFTTTLDAVRTLLPEAIAKRVWQRKALWLVRGDPFLFTARLHSVDLNLKYSCQGLDVIELRAVWAAMPPEFENDGDGSKAAWRLKVLERLQELVAQEDSGNLSKALRRSPPYVKYFEVQKSVVEEPGELHIKDRELYGPYDSNAEDLYHVQLSGHEDPTPADRMEEVAALCSRRSSMDFGTVEVNNDTRANNSTRNQNGFRTHSLASQPTTLKAQSDDESCGSALMQELSQKLIRRVSHQTHTTTDSTKLSDQLLDPQPTQESSDDATSDLDIGSWSSRSSPPSWADGSDASTSNIQTNPTKPTYKTSPSTSRKLFAPKNAQNHDFFAEIKEKAASRSQGRKITKERQ